MRPRRKIRVLACVAGALALGLVEGRVYAQACCIAPGAAGASRLAPHEEALVGAEARAEAAVGSFDSTGRFWGQPAGVHDLALEQSVFGTLRVLDRVQLSATVPFVQTMRSTETASAFGGGLGDLRASVRYDVAFPDDAWPWPGLAISAGGSAPTGRPPERAGDPLGTGATGTGTTQVWGGVSGEQTFGPWLANASAIVTVRANRDVGPIRVSMPPRFTGALVGARAWRSGHALSLAASYDVEGRASADGVVVSGSARRALRVVSALQLRLGEDARFVASIFGVPPIPVVSAGSDASIGLSLTLIHPWS